jgi:hypothetical protein
MIGVAVWWVAWKLVIGVGLFAVLSPVGILVRAMRAGHDMGR